MVVHHYRYSVYPGHQPFRIHQVMNAFAKRILNWVGSVVRSFSIYDFIFYNYNLSHGLGKSGGDGILVTEASELLQVWLCLAFAPGGGHVATKSPIAPKSAAAGHDIPRLAHQHGESSRSSARGII
jgi:hypothetical protein